MLYYNGGHEVKAVYWLTGLIILSFILQMAIPGFTDAFIFDPTTALAKPYTILTTMFLHASFSHIFFNLLALIMFGPIVESRVGAKAFLIIYFLSGIVGGVLYWLTIIAGIIPPLPALGASGAIYGILAAAAVFFPQLVVYVWFIPMRMRTALVVWFLMEFFGVFDVGSGIASAAHLGGLIVGYLYAKSLKDRENRWLYPDSF